MTTLYDIAKNNIGLKLINIIEKYQLNKPTTSRNEHTFTEIKLSRCKHITLDIINKTPYNWSINHISENSNITQDFISKIIKTKDINQICWYSLSKNPAITPEYIENNINLPWVWDSMCYNPSITWNFIEKTKSFIPWNKYWLCSNPNTTIEILETNYSAEDYNTDELEFNPNLTCDFISNHKNDINSYQWDWDNISYHKNITWQDIEDTKDDEYFQWVPKYVCCNPNITWKIIMDNQEYLNSWNVISENPNITWDNVRNNLDKDWDWDCLSSTLELTYNIIEQNQDKDWNAINLLTNPSFTIEELIKIYELYKDKWRGMELISILDNTLLKEYTNEIERLKQKYNIIYSRKAHRNKRGLGM